MAKIIYASALLMVLFLSLPSALNAENQKESPVASPAGSLFVSEGKTVEVEEETSWFNWFLQSAGASNSGTDSLAAGAPEPQAVAAPALAPAPSAQSKSLRYLFLW